MSAISSTAILPEGVKARSARHYDRHGAGLSQFRLAVQRELEAQVGRMCRNFIAPPLEEQAGPILTALRDYVTWLGWCGWCCVHLAPPLGLTGERDARRMAAALIAYSGPRLVDDAIDEHRDYKGIRPTLLNELLVSFPEQAPGAVRTQAALLGFWMSLYGVRRLARIAGNETSRQVLRLCEQIAPGVIVEGLSSHPFSRPQHDQLVLLKSVYYDQILYRCLVAPVPPPLQAQLLEIAARLSRLAQYLNDFMDRGEDRDRRRKNFHATFSTPEEFHRFCRQESAAAVEALQPLSDDLGDAFCAALIETIDAVARMEARLKPACRPAI